MTPSRLPLRHLDSLILVLALLDHFNLLPCLHWLSDDLVHTWRWIMDHMTLYSSVAQLPRTMCIVKNPLPTVISCHLHLPTMVTFPNCPEYFSHRSFVWLVGLFSQPTKQTIYERCCLVCLGGFRIGSGSKESACNAQGHRFNPWIRKIPWRREWLPIPVFLPWGRKESGMTEWLSLSLFLLVCF